MDVPEVVGKFLLDSIDYSKDSGESGHFPDAYRRLKETLGVPDSELEKILTAVKTIAERGIAKYAEEMNEEVQVTNRRGVPLPAGVPIEDHWPVKIEPDVDDAELHLDMNDDRPLLHRDDPMLWTAADWDGKNDEEARPKRPVAPRFLRQQPQPPPPNEEPAAPVQEMGALQPSADPTPGPSTSQPSAPRAPKTERKGVCSDCNGPCSKKAARCRPCRGLFVKAQTAARKAAARQQ